MNYLTYSEYVNMGGQIDSPSTFQGYEFQSENVVNWYTYNRLTYVPLSEQPERTQEAVKRFVFEHIKLLQAQDSLLGFNSGEAGDVTVSNIVRQSNDGVDTTYNTIAAEEVGSVMKRRVHTLIRMYLAGCLDNKGRDITYKGFYPDE